MYNNEKTAKAVFSLHFFVKIKTQHKNHLQYMY